MTCVGSADRCRRRRMRIGALRRMRKRTTLTVYLFTIQLTLPLTKYNTNLPARHNRKNPLLMCARSELLL